MKVEVNRQQYRGESEISPNFKPKENPSSAVWPASSTPAKELSHPLPDKKSRQALLPFTSKKKMANLRSSMDAAFWDMNISTPQAIDGVARSIPGDPIPLDNSRASRALRFQQISLIGNGFPLGIIPSFSPSADHKELGSIALQSLIGKADFGNWYLAVISFSFRLLMCYTCGCEYIFVFFLKLL